MFKEFIITTTAAAIIIGCSPCGRYISSLKNDDVEIRREAAFQLCKLDKINKSMVTKLVAATEDKDPLVREFALKAMAKLPPKTEGVATAVRYCLGDPDISVRRTAAGIFSQMNPVPSEVLIPLAETLGDTDSVMNSYVKSTFVYLGVLGVNALMYSCKSENNQLRYGAITTLGTIGGDARRALPVLQGLLNDQNDSIRTAAKSSIEKIQLSFSSAPKK